MAGISSKAAGKMENKNDKFQGQPLDDDLGLNWYGFKYRNHDPQIGRFIQVDPLSEKYVYNSTYAFSENKVTNHVELEGLESANANDMMNPVLKAAMKENVQQHVRSFNKNLSGSVEVKLSTGAGAGFKMKMGKSELKLGASGPQAEVSLSGSGKLSAQGSLADVKASLETPIGEGNANMSIGVLGLSDGKVSASDVRVGLDGKLKVQKELNQGNTTQTLEAGSDGDIALGAKLGVVGGEIKVNVIKAGNAFLDFVKGGVELIRNMLNDKVKTPQTVKRQQGNE